MPVDLSEENENNIVDIFKQGLNKYIEEINGKFVSRSISLREENVYPSDQDIAILIKEGEEFFVNLFGLQFKRYSNDGWHINTKQLEKLKLQNKILSYCFPFPHKTVLTNSLYHYCFVNPIILPNSTNKIVDQSIFFDGIYPVGDYLLEKRVEESIFMNNLKKQSSSSYERMWGNMLYANYNNSRLKDLDILVPHLSWGEFFELAKIGGRVVFLSNENPPDKGNTNNNQENIAENPEIRETSGIGLGILSGKNHLADFEHTKEIIRSHMKDWANSFLEKPAALIAYNSFSNVLEFFQIN
ncbi:MAG: hypothetical protein GY928_14065 [Colwellia sp.]|nr:hypothetical protein [Colwellia sp.]